MTFVLRRSRPALPVLAALAGLLVATPALAGSSSNAQRAFARCQQTVAREGLSYSTQMQWRLSRCVRTLGDCSAGNSSSCRMAPSACHSTGDDLAYLVAVYDAVPVRRLGAPDAQRDLLLLGVDLHYVDVDFVADVEQLFGGLGAVPGDL